MNKLNIRYKLSIIILTIWSGFWSIFFGFWSQTEYKKAYPTSIEKNEMIEIANMLANQGIFSKKNNILLNNLEKYSINEINLENSYIIIEKNDDIIEYYVKVNFYSDYTVKEYEILPNENIKICEILVAYLIGGGTAFVFGTLIIFFIFFSNKERQ